MKMRKITFWAVLFLTGMLAACSGNTSMPTSPAVITPTAAITSTAAKIVWAGDHPTGQVDLIQTITGSPIPFKVVSGLAIDQEGDLYVVDQGNARVLKYDGSGKFLMEWGSKGTGDGQFDMSGNLSGNATGMVAVDSQGNVYVTDKAHVQKFDSQGKFLAKWGVQGTSVGDFPLAGRIAIDSQDNVYVVNMDNENVQKYDGSGKFLLKWGEHGSGEGQFATPTAVMVDSQGDILVSDARTSRIQKFDRNGKFLSMVYLGSVDGLGITPASMALGSQGQVFIGEFGNPRVVEFDSSGKLLAAWGNTGPSKEQLSEVNSLAIDKDGTLYIADAFNQRVLKYRVH